MIKKAKKAHLSLRGKVIGVDDQGVMIEMTDESGPCGMYVPYKILGDLPIYGSTINVDVSVDVDTQSMTMKMTLEDADKTREQG